MSVLNGQYVCEVILPENSPLRSATGLPYPRKSHAKQSAAFAACVKLRKDKYLDAHLLPIYQKRLPTMRNAQLALHLKTNKSYGMRTKPSVWAESVGTVPEELFVTIISLGQPENGESTRRPLALLTRKPLPQLPQFPVYLDTGPKTPVILTNISKSLQVSGGRIDAINCFTLRLFNDCFSKLYEPNPERMPYWLAPTAQELMISPESPVENVIDWECLNLVHDHEYFPWNQDTPNEFLANKFVVDPLDGSRRFFTIGVDPKLKATDPLPPDARSRRFDKNILDYSISLYKNSRAKAKYRPDQPVILAELVLHRRNWLDEMTEKEKGESKKCYICPEPLQISPVRHHPRASREKELIWT